MKIKLGIGIILLAALVASAQTNNLTALLQQGLFEEQASRDLDAAIVSYQTLAAQFDKDRQLAATAVFRLGECYRAQGKTNEAAVQYQRILKDFSDQQKLATLSRQNLAGMGAAETPFTKASQQQKDLLTQQIALAEQDLADAKSKVKTGTATESEARAAEKELLRLRQQLAALDSNYRADLLNVSFPAKSEEDQEIERIEKLIKDSPDLINKADNSGNTLLSQAATKGQVKVVNYLLDHGAEVDAGFSALAQATRAGNRAMVELLLKRGAKVNLPAEYGRTALTMAAEQGFVSVVELLLTNKADPNAVDRRNGRTTLYSTVMNGQDKCVRQLVAVGADVNRKADDGTTALSVAAERGWVAMVKMLLEAKADPNGGTKNQPLLGAIAAKNKDLAEMLLQAGANPNVPGKGDFIDAKIEQDTSYLNNHDRMTPLWFAVYLNQPEMVKLLLKYKANPDDSETDRRPMIFNALYREEILSALLDAGAKVDARDATAARYNNKSLNWTPLLLAVEVNYPVEVVEILLKHGANPNLQDEAFGNTPLGWSMGWGNDHLPNPKVLEVLLDHKADPNTRNFVGITLLNMLKNDLKNATSDNQVTINKLADLLRQHGALDYLPDWNRIIVSRPSTGFSAALFECSTNHWNHFTLLELVYRKAFDVQGELNFPDLAHIVVARPSADGATIKRITVNLLNATNGLAVSQDIPLEFGDVVEIPEREHTLAEPAVFLTQQQGEQLQQYLVDRAGSVKLVVTGGKTVKINLPGSYLLIKTAVQTAEALAALTSSSDLSRVKVSRLDSRTGKKEEWIVDCQPEKPNNSMLPGTLPIAQPTFQQRLQNIINNNGDSLSDTTNLWLRNGDVIEVPLK